MYRGKTVGYLRSIIFDQYFAVELGASLAPPRTTSDTFSHLFLSLSLFSIIRSRIETCEYEERERERDMEHEWMDRFEKFEEKRLKTSVEKKYINK